MTDAEALAKAILTYPWAFPPGSDQEDARIIAKGGKPRDWTRTRAKAIEQVRAAC